MGTIGYCPVQDFNHEVAASGRRTFGITACEATVQVDFTYQRCRRTGRLATTGRGRTRRLAALQDRLRWLANGGGRRPGHRPSALEDGEPPRRRPPQHRRPNRPPDRRVAVLLAAPVRADGQQLLAEQSVDFCVHPDFQRLGIRAKCRQLATTTSRRNFQAHFGPDSRHPAMQRVGR